MLRCWFPLLIASLAWSQQDAVFRSDVSLARVDVQALDRDHRAITGLTAADFILRESGNPQEIRNFQAENMPLDVVLLFDVSVSMRPNVETIVSAAHQALRVLGREDRVAVMVFDRASRVRLPFRGNLEEVERELDQLVHHERFNGGTDITRAMLDAAAFIGREGRTNARRAIVILTDDATEKERDEEAVNRALTKADTVLSLLLAPNSMEDRQDTQRGGGGYPGGGGRRGRGGMGGGVGGGPLGGIWGPRYPRSGGGGGQPYPNGGQGGRGGRSRTHTAGTAEIARASGGEEMSIDQTSALETTLNRLRQRYALHFNSDSAKAGKRLVIGLQLSDAALRRYPDAELRFRRVYLGSEAPTDEPISVTRAGDGRTGGQRRQVAVRPATNEPEPAPVRHRPAVSEAGGPSGPILQPEPPPL